MDYNFLVKDSATGAPIKGAQLAFIVAKESAYGPIGMAVLTVETDPTGLVTVDTGTDEPFYSDITLQISAPGYQSVSTPGGSVPYNYTVKLVKKGGSSGVLLAAGAVGLGGVLLLTGKKRRRKAAVSGVFDNVDPRIKTAAFIAIGIGGYYLVNHLLTSSEHHDDLSKDAGGALQQLASQGIYPTIDSVTAESFASSLRTAFDDCGTDEGVVYTVFSQLNNKADVYLLIATYGTRSYKGCFDGDYFSTHSWNLAEALTSELGSGELAQLNNILSQKGIDYNF